MPEDILKEKGIILYAFAIAISLLNVQVSLILFILFPIYSLIPAKYIWIRSTKSK